MSGRADRRPTRGDRRQPAEGQGWRALRRLGRQSGSLHLAVRRLRDSAALPRRCPGLHDREAGRASGHHSRRRQDDHGGVRSHRSAAIRDPAQGLRRWSLRDERPGLRSRSLHRLAERNDRRHGPRGRGERGLLQQAGRPVGRGPGEDGGEAPRRIPLGRRHRAPGERDQLPEKEPVCLAGQEGQRRTQEDPLAEIKELPASFPVPGESRRPLRPKAGSEIGSSPSTWEGRYER